MAFFGKNESSEYDSYVFSTEFAQNHEEICRFVERVIGTERFALREVVAFTSEKRYQVSRKNTTQERWMAILLGKLGTGKIRAVVVDGQYDEHDCEIGVGVKNGSVCLTLKKGESFDFRPLLLSLGLVDAEGDEDEARRKQKRRRLDEEIRKKGLAF